MVQGSNVRCQILQITQDTDDSAGGAMTTGTVIHTNVPARIQQQKEEQILLQQGLETPKIWTAIVTPVTLSLEERYELEVTCPTNYYLYGERLRIINWRPADFAPNDPRDYVLLTLSKSVKAHSDA